VGAKSKAAHVDARQLWTSATSATRASTQTLLSQAVSSEAKKSAAATLKDIQQAEDKLREIVQLLPATTGRGVPVSATAALAGAALGSNGRASSPSSRQVLARQAAAELAEAEVVLAQLTSDLTSRGRRAA
jgi:hypothetical protein